MDKGNKQVMPGPIVIYDGNGEPVTFLSKTSNRKLTRIAQVPQGRIKTPVLGYRGYWSRAAFWPGEYDMAEIGRAADTDSYLARSFKKKVGLLMKEGYRWVGKNPATILYIKNRVAQIERATGYPFLLMVREIAGDLVKFSNAYICKVRSPTASGGQKRKHDGKSVNPVAGYFRVPPETMLFKRDQNGQVIKYQQRILRPLTAPKTGQWPEWDPIDMIHLYHDRKGGFAVGTPDTVPVLDDVRILRRMEEDIELLVYQHLFPLYHYTVGTENQPAQVYDDGQTEVDIVRQQVEEMPAEGCIVTPERHTIEVKGSQGKALRADPLVEHFKKRVWAGLAMSGIDFGEGSTANRNTADALSAALIDCVKDFQGVMQLFTDFFIIGELLMESTFTFDTLAEEHMVHMRFNEVDLEAKIKRDSNAVNLFQGHLMSETEARKEMGEEPIEDEQREDMYWQRVEMPRLIIQALDEPFTPEAKEAMAASAGPSSPQSPAVAAPKPGRSAKPKKPTGGQGGTKAIKKTATKKTEGKTRGGKAAKARVQPTNQHGTNPGPTKRKSSTDPKFGRMFDAFKEAVFLLLYRDLLEEIRLDDHAWRKQMSRLVESLINSKYREFVRSEFYGGLRDVAASRHATHTVARVRIKETQDYATRRISLLTDRVLDTIETMVLQGHGKDIIRAALDSYAFRANFLDRTVRRQARIFGQAIGLLLDGHETVYIFRDPGEKEECDKCDKFTGAVIALDHLAITDIPPWHDNCNCVLSLHPLQKHAKVKETTDFTGTEKSLKDPDNKKVGLNKRVKLDGFDQKEFHLGVAIEFEHTEHYQIATEIVKDHLVQYPGYYTELAAMEEEGKDAMQEPETPEQEAMIKKAEEMDEEGDGPGLHRHVSDNDFDRKELLMGIEVEYEHTEDMEISKQLSKDHLSEIPDYYTRLHAMQDDINAQMEQHLHRQSDGEYTGPPEENPEGEGHIHLKADGENYTGPEKGPHGIHTHKGGEGPPVFEKEYEDEETQDFLPKVERCIIEVKKDLTSRHPTWSAERVKSSAIAICRSKFEPGAGRRGRKRDASKTAVGNKLNSACIKKAKASIRKENKGLSAKEINALAERICKMHALDPNPQVPGHNYPRG